MISKKPKSDAFYRTGLLVKYALIGIIVISALVTIGFKANEASVQKVAEIVKGHNE